MPRRLRIEFDGAIYHVMTRGNARQDIVHDDDDRTRLLADLERTVLRFGWEVLAFVVMGNHLHLLLKTPRPNLAKGMQAFLSAYALYAAHRRRRPGHLFQGRYKAEMIEDETYYWTVSRYIHLNPVRAGLAARPKTGNGRAIRDMRRRRSATPGSNTTPCSPPGMVSGAGMMPPEPIDATSRPASPLLRDHRSARALGAGSWARAALSSGCGRWPRPSRWNHRRARRGNSRRWRRGPCWRR